MIKRICVLGGGSAGFLAAMTLKRRLPELDVVVVRSKEIGIINVGEGSTIALPQHLHGYLKIDLGEFFRQAQPQWKLGIRFLWGPRPGFDYTFAKQLDLIYPPMSMPAGYYCGDGAMPDMGVQSALMSRDRVFLRDRMGLPQITPDHGYHIENERFAGFLEGEALKLGVVVREDTVSSVEQDESGVRALRLASGERLEADLFVDCSGFRSVLLGGALGERFASFASSLFCDRAVIGGWPRGADEPIRPYTTAETMDAGWCWQIEHEERVNRGYVYASAFIGDEEAEREFRRKNPRVGPTRVVKFISGRYERMWVKNVVGIGNAAGFVEPLESTALTMICTGAQSLAETIAACDGRPGPVLVRHYNLRQAAMWDSIRRFLAVHYRFNTRLDTPFWQACRERTDLAGAEAIVELYRENGPGVLYRESLLDPLDQFGMEGYLTMLVGQRAPCEREFRPPAADLDAFERLQRAIARMAEQAFTVRQALNIVRWEGWEWPAMYRGAEMRKVG